MARIKTYSVDNQISDNDIVIGSDADNLSQTKNYNVANLRQYVLSGLEPETGGTLKITTITETSETYLTPESWINNQDPAIEVLQYEIIFLILNGRTYIFRKNNAIYGVGESQAVADDFTEIDITSVINANLQDLDSVLEQGNESSDKNVKINSIYLWDNHNNDDYGSYINGDKDRVNFFKENGDSIGVFEKEQIQISTNGVSNYLLNFPTLSSQKTATFQNASGTVAYLSDIPTNYISSITSPSDELDVTTVAGETTIVYTPKTEVKLIGSELLNSITNTTYFSNGGSFSYDETLYPINGIDLKFNGNITSNGTDYGFYAFHYENGNNIIAPIEFLGSSISGDTLRVKFDLATYWNTTPGARLSFVEINLYQGTLISEDGLYFEGTAPSSQVRYFNSWLFNASEGYPETYKVIAQNFTDSTAVTGTTDITTVETFEIPANTFQAGDVIIFKARIIKTGANGVVSHRHEIGNEGFPQIEMFSQTSSSSNLYSQMERTIVVKSSTITEDISATANAVTSNGGFSSNQRSNIDWTIPQDLFIKLNNQHASDSSIVSFWQLIRIRP